MRKRKTSRRPDAGRISKPAGSRSGVGGPDWIYGRHAVIAALNNPRRAPGRLVATQEAAARLRADLPDAAPEILNRADIDALLPDLAVHQGIALSVSPPAPVPLEELLADSTTQTIVVLDQVTDPHNVGAVLRSAAAFGAAAVVVHDRSAPPSAGALSKAASGALDLVPLIRVPNLARALEQIASAGFWSIGFDGDATASLTEVPLDHRIALVLGAEGSGLRRLTRDACDHLVRIPTPGALATLNVSNAAAIALYETARRRIAREPR